MSDPDTLALGVLIGMAGAPPLAFVAFLAGDKIGAWRAGRSIDRMLAELTELTERRPE